MLKDCPYCLEEIKQGAIICKHCKSNLSEALNLSQAPGSMLTFEWIGGTFCLPVVGGIGWIYGLVKGRKGSWGLLGIGIATWIFWWWIFATYAPEFFNFQYSLICQNFILR